MEESAPELFHQETHVEGNLVIWRISGRMDFARYEELKLELGRLIERKSQSLLLDLQGLESIDSRGLGFLLTAQGEVRAIQGRLALVHLDAKFATLFETSRLNRIFEIFLDLESARRSFGTLQSGHGIPSRP